MEKNYNSSRTSLFSCWKSLFTIMIVLFSYQNVAAQVDVTATAGTPAASYTTVKGAFDAINAGTHQGAIAISLTGNTTETASAVLNSGTVAPAAYTSVGITATVPVTISGTIVGAIIKLNGADNVTIDGRIAGTGRNITVQNNSTAAATAAIWLASVAAGNGCSNNVVRNLELLTGIDPTTTANSTFGIIMCGTTISTTANGVDNDNNSFIANRIIKARYGIVTRGTTTDLNIAPIVTDNIIGPAAFGTDQISRAGIFMQADTGALVSRNTVQFVGVLEPQAASGADRVGIAVGSETWSMTDTGTITSANYTITRNVIHDIVEENTFSAVGIKLGTTQSGGATNNLVANNMIYNVRSNGTSGDQVCGIGISGGNGDVIANNSISITGDMDPGAATASATNGNAIRIPGANGTNNANFVIRNNSIYLDASSSSTAALRFYAISLNSNAYVFGTGGLNHNNYYINAANTQLQTGALGTATTNAQTTQFATLANWQVALTAPQDANSIQADPLYVSASSDLHLAAGSPNIDAGTAIASVTIDIDNGLRPNGAGYDIGCDEFGSVAGSGAFQFSATNYSGIEGNTVAITVNRIGGSIGAVDVTYTLTDGTASGGAACGVGVDFVNSGPQVLNFADGEVSKIFNVSLCTDLVIDVNENFSVTLSAPTGGATLANPFATTVTITDFAPPFNGTYTVGATGTYPSLTNTGGIFEAINLSGATGNITINIVSDLSGETGLNSLNEITGGFTTLIQPSGGARTVTGSINGALIKLNGADGVTINGSTAGATAAACLVGGDAAIRELTFTNTNVGTAAAVISVQSGTNGAQNNTIKNVSVIGQDPSTTLIGISLGGNTPGTVGTDNDNNRVENCLVQKAVFGIYAAGLSLANQNTGTVIKQNDISGTGANRVRNVGILIFNDNAGEISYNHVGGIDNTGISADAVGIGVGTQGVDTTVTTAGGITNVLVTNNKVNGVSNDTTFSAVGIAVAGAAGGTNTIANNMISGVISDATTPDLVSGIHIAGVTSSDTRLYHNTVSMSGDRSALLTPGTTQMPSYAVAITGIDPTVELKNNILNTSQFAEIVANPNAKSYAIGMVATTFVNLNSNYNDFVSSGVQDGGFRSGSLATAAGNSYADVATWAAAVTDDANSVEITPVFLSASDLHLDTVLNPTLDNLGTPIATVTQDYDCEARNATTPDMGADEGVFLNINQFDLADGLRAYPNPVNNILNIEYTSDLSSISVYNMLGQQVLAKKVTATSTQLDLSGLNVGTYLVKVEAGTVSTIVKVFKK